MYLHQTVQTKTRLYKVDDPKAPSSDFSDRARNAQIVQKAPKRRLHPTSRI